MTLVALSSWLVASLQSVLSPPALSHDPLCGINALYSAAVLLERDPSYGDLLRSEYVGSEEGSSLAELERAASRLGLHSLAISNLSTSDLRWSDYPVILHVKNDLSSPDYNHFVLFVGFRDNKALVFDGPRGLQEFSAAELATRWDGKGLVLSKVPINGFRLTHASWVTFLGWVGAIAGVYALGRIAQDQLTKARRRPVNACCQQALLVLVMAGVGAFAFHCTSAEGFMSGGDAVRAVRAANAARFLPKLDYASVRQLSDSDAAIFVDARSAKEFHQGHLPRAINLPANTPDSEAFRFAAQLPRQRRIIVYCASPSCPSSLLTAKMLLRAGHGDVLIYPGGWKEWNARMQGDGQ